MKKLIFPCQVCLILTLSYFITQLAVGASVYKVESLYKNGDVSVRKGSGIALSIAGSDYILTSSHVIFHGTDADSVSHFSLSESGTRIKHSLVAVDFGRGLALLKSTQPLEDRFSFQEWKTEPTTIENGSSGHLLGFPYDLTPPLEKPLVTHNAVVESSQTMRVILPFIKNVIEVNSRSEFGMSGGAFVTEVGRYVGMISHHYLKQVSLGDTAHIFEYSESDISQMAITPLIIPVSEIIPWIDSAIAGEEKANLREDLKSQLLGVFSAHISGMQFTEMNCRKNYIPTEPRETAKVSKGKVYLAASGDGAGIGGDRTPSSGDGAGIGGDIKEEIRSEKCIVKIEKSQHASQGTWQFAAAKSVQFMKSKLSSHVREIEWDSLLDPESFQVYSFASLLHALTWVQRGYLPLFKETKFFGNSSELMDERLARSSKILKVQSAKLRHNGSQSPSQDKLLNEIDGIHDLIANNMSSALVERIKRLEAIALPENGSEYESAWLDLSRANSDSAARLQSALIGIYDQFKERSR